MLVEKLVQGVTPTAPLAADFEQDAPVGTFGFRDGVVNVTRRVAFGIVFRDGCVRRLREGRLRYEGTQSAD